MAKCFSKALASFSAICVIFTVEDGMLVLLVTVAAFYCVLARCLRCDLLKLKLYWFVCSSGEVLLIEFVEFNLRWCSYKYSTFSLAQQGHRYFLSMF